MSDLKELKRLHAEAKANEPLADEVFLAVMIDNFPAILARLEAAERGEFICHSCGIRKDADASNIDPKF